MQFRKPTGKELKVALAIAIPTAVATGHILAQRRTIRGLEVSKRYYAEKLDSALTKLTPEKLEEMSQEVDSDVTFFEMAKTTLKDTL